MRYKQYKFIQLPTLQKMGNVDGQFILSGIMKISNSKYKIFTSYGINQGLSDAIYKWSDNNGWQFVSDYRNLGHKSPFNEEKEELLYQERIIKLEEVFNTLCIFAESFSSDGKYIEIDIMKGIKENKCLVYS
jgi:hypothetical protein